MFCNFYQSINGHAKNERTQEKNETKILLKRVTLYVCFKVCFKLQNIARVFEYIYIILSNSKK